MALQDNFNIILNKTEQNKQQRELQKQQDKTFEIQLQEELQKAIEAYCEENNKSNLYLLKTKHKIIHNILYYNNFKVYKNSKYKDIQNIKNYLSDIYNKTVNRVLKIYRIIDKEKEETEQIQNILIEQETQEETKQKNKIEYNKIFKSLQTITFYVLVGVICFLWGFMSLGNPKRKKHY